MRQSNHQYSSTPDHYANAYNTQSQQSFQLKSNSIKGGRSSMIVPGNNNNSSYSTSYSQQNLIQGNQQNQNIQSQNSLPPSSSISMKLKNSLIIQKESQKNKENVFRLKERVEEAQKRVDNLEQYEKSFNGMTDLLNGIAKDFKQSYVVSRTSYSPVQQKSHIASRQNFEEIELSRGKRSIVDCSNIFEHSQNPTQDIDTNMNKNYQNLSYQSNQLNFNKQSQQIHDQMLYEQQQQMKQQLYQQQQQQLLAQQKRVENMIEAENDNLKKSQLQQNNLATIRKNKLFKDIKNKLELFKTQNRDSITKHLKYIANKINDNQEVYYNFFDEENKVVLKFLAQVLYDEVEKILILDGGNSLPQKLKVEDLTKEINEKNKKIQQLEEELIEKNLNLNSLTTKLTRYTQRFNDLRWILEESKRIYEDFIIYQQELLSNDMYAYDESRKLKFIQITNIQKEFNRLKENFDELRIGNSNQKTNPNQANFFFQNNNLSSNSYSTNPHASNSQLKTNNYNNHQLENSASQSSHICVPDMLIKKQLEFDEEYMNSNQYSSMQNINHDSNSQSSTNLFNIGLNNNSSANLMKKNRNNSVSSTSHTMMMPNKMHYPTTTNRSLTPNAHQQGNNIETMYQSNIISSDHNQGGMYHSQIPQRANQSMIIVNNTSSSQIIGKSGNKFLDIKQQIEQLENEYNELDTFHQSLEDQVAKYKHCFVEQLKLCQLLQKSVHSLEEDNNQLKSQIKSQNNIMHTSQLMQAANQQQAELEKDLQKFAQQLKQSQKECETLQQENDKIQKEYKEVQQKYNSQVKQLQQIEEQRLNDKQLVQKLNSQFQSMKRECEEKQTLQEKLSSLSNDNNHLNKELDECLGLLESGKINIEQLKNTLHQKEESTSDLNKKNANLENQVFLKQKEIEKLTQEQKKILEQIEELQKSKGKDAVKNLIDQQKQTLPQIEFLIFEENMNEEIQKETKQLIIQLFGSEFLQFTEKIQEKHLYLSQFNQTLYEKLQNHCNSRIQSCEDIKIMGQMILQAYEVLSRHSNVQLPTPVMMLREEFEMKRQAIQDKLQECVYEQQQIFEEFNNISLMGSQLGKGKNMNQQEQNNNEVQSLQCRIEQLTKENTMLQQNIKNIETQYNQMCQQSGNIQNNKLPRPSLEHNRQSDIQSNRSSRRPSRLKQDSDEYGVYSASGLNSVKNGSPQKQHGQLFEANDDFLQLLLSQASSIEQLLNQ